jgi:hypothetical protein
MAKETNPGARGIFWITFVILGLGVLIGFFVWMVKSRNPLPHSPERPNGTVWSEPLPARTAATG